MLDIFNPIGAAASAGSLHWSAPCPLLGGDPTTWGRIDSSLPYILLLVIWRYVQTVKKGFNVAVKSATMSQN